MDKRIRSKAGRLSARRRLKNIMAKTGIGLSCALVFCIVYALVAPGLTAEWPLECGKEEHTHSESCWTVQTVTPEPELTCGLEETEGHTHGDGCYDPETGELTCQQPEQAAHHHTDACWTHSEPTEERVLTCGKEEHTHSESCYVVGETQSPYACGLAEHQHGPECYTDGQLHCTMPEHTHDDSCLRENVQAEAERVAREIDETCSYEYDELNVTFHVEGTVLLPKEATDSAAPETTEAPELRLEVENTELEPSEEEVLIERRLDLSLLYGQEELDLSQCQVTAELTPSEMLVDFVETSAQTYALAAEDVAPEDQVETGVEIEVLDETGHEEVLMIGAGMDVEPMTIPVKGSSLTLRTAPTPNPTFTVEYYAMLDTVVRNKVESKFPVINTDKGGAGTGAGGRLPVNSGNPVVDYLQTNADGTIKTTVQRTEIYQKEEFKYVAAPGLNYFDIVTSHSKYYKITQFEVYDPIAKKWTTYPYEEEKFHFTNRELGENKAPGHTYVQIVEGMIVRIIYDYNTEEDYTYTNDVNFYDYDISDGNIYTSSSFTDSSKKDTSTQTNNTRYYAKTGKQGINSDSNYSGTGAKLGFGNANAGTNRETERWTDPAGKSIALNCYNRASTGTATYRGGSYGLVTGMNGKGNDVTFASGITAPNLFGEGGAAGKELVSGSLDFTRKGDTYTLSRANVGGGVVPNLDRMKLLAEGTWSNNFWPMDLSPTYGADGHDLKFGNKSLAANRQFADNKNLPTSDDRLDHNSYFGMNFALRFELTENYIGPLEYYFFGDDDMWVFLAEYDKNDSENPYKNPKLICDIGGIHSATGEYVNLWDYINKKDLGQTDEQGNEEAKAYALVFFYTERGASGSTCWMQFTLPTVVGLNLEAEIDKILENNTSALVVEKQVTGVETEQDFTFKINLKNADGSALLDDYLYTKYNADGSKVKTEDGSGVILLDEAVHDGSEFTLKHGQYIVITNLPVDALYSVEEVVPESKQHFPFRTSWSVTTTDKENKVCAQRAGNGCLVRDDRQNKIQKDRKDTVTFTNIASVELPATGGPGLILWYTLAGLMVLSAACLVYKKILLIVREGGED